MTAIWRPALLAAALVLAGAVLHWLPGGAAGALSRAGRFGMPGFVFGATLLCAVGMPRQVAAYAGGLAFGFWPGAAVALLAQVLSCALDLLWARALGRAWARQQMRRRLGGRLARLDAFLSANPFGATLTLRLLPVGSNLLLNLLAGVSGIATGPFLVASALGYVPQTAVFALLGTGARIDHGAQLAMGVALFACSALGGTLLLRRVRAVAA